MRRVLGTFLEVINSRDRCFPKISCLQIVKGPTESTVRLSGLCLAYLKCLQCKAIAMTASWRLISGSMIKYHILPSQKDSPASYKEVLAINLPLTNLLLWAWLLMTLAWCTCKLSRRKGMPEGDPGRLWSSSSLYFWWLSLLPTGLRLWPLDKCAYPTALLQCRRPTLELFKQAF